MAVYVGNLSYDVTREDLEHVFQEYGSIRRITLPTDRETGRPRGFAFVEMASEDKEQEVIDALDGAEWMGREMKVNKARARSEASAGAGGGRSNYRRSSF